MNTHKISSMSALEFQAAMEPSKNAIYDTLIETADCGPFDGGCVVFAQALQRVMGGTVVVLTSAGGVAQHACVERGKQLFDFDGPLPPALFIKRFSKNEFVESSGYREIETSDLVEAYRGIELENDLVLKLQAVFAIQPAKTFTIHANSDGRGRFVGMVVDIFEGIVTQKTTRQGDTVKHDASMLSSSVQMGDVVDIQYRDGQGVVTDIGKTVAVIR